MGMHSCEEGAIVSGVRQAGLIILQGKSGPVWGKERFAGCYQSVEMVRWGIMTQQKVDVKEVHREIWITVISPAEAVACYLRRLRLRLLLLVI